MSLLNFNTSDPKRSGERKTLSIILGIGALVGVIAIGSTLAASINLNNSGPVEFGQGVAQTVACDSDGINLKPESTFINSQGGGSFMGTNIVVSDVDSSTGGCGGKIFTITAFGKTSPIPIAQIVVTVSATSPWFTTEAISGVTLTDLSSSSFTITIDPNLVPIEASEVFQVTLESRDSVYQVGDTGPGGGKIYYVAATNFDCGPTLNLKCKYLEVAPSGWNMGIDPLKSWSVTAYFNADVSDIVNEVSPYNSAAGIGLGYKNSKAIVDQGNDNTSAAGLAREYSGGSKNDWYLPNTAELNLLCQWARDVTQVVTTACTGGTLNTGTGSGGGFDEYFYWSSSEFPEPDARLQGFDDGAQVNSHKDGTYRVRPIRAF